MATTSKNNASASDAVEEDVKVPHQHAEKVAATVTEIKKSNEPVFDGETSENITLIGKAKRLVKDKRVVAGAATVALLTIGVFVARKRNSVEETDETPEA